MTRARETGVSLLNVLVVVAASAGLVHVMLSGQDRAIARISLAADASQARALAQAGVTSLAVALRRDLRDAPDSDHLNEDWADAAQQVIAFEGGQFSVEVGDLRGRFDLNALGPMQLTEARVFAALLDILDLPTALAREIARIIAEVGPLKAPEDLLKQGVSQDYLTRLTPYVTALPHRHKLNLNTVPQPLLAALFANPAAARNLEARRAARGYLDKSDLAALGLVLPPLAGFTSDAFGVVATASVGDAMSVLARHILRDGETGQVMIRSGL